MLISLNFNINCLTLLTIYLLKSLDAINHSSHNWITFDEHTIYFISDVNQWTDWRTADTICRSKQSNLVSIHDKIQNEFLLNHTKYLNQQFWIGLRSDLWSDKSDLDYNNPDLSDTNNFEEISSIEEMCATFQSLSGFWKYNDCNEKFGFICQKSTQNINQKSQNQQTKSCQITGFSPEEGIKFGNHCYVFIDKHLLDWSQSQLICNDMNESNLLSITTSDELQFIKNYTLMNFNNTEFWIGLKGNKNDSQIYYQWSDESSVDLSLWEPKEPPIHWNNSNDICVYQSNNSEWSIDSCTHKRHYICKSKDVKKETKNNTKLICPSTTSSDNFIFNWSEVDTNSEFCFWFSKDFDTNLLKTTWTEASFRCRSHNSTLASIHSLESLWKMKSKIIENTWIGLSINEKGYFKWEDNSGLDFTFWDYKVSDNKSDQKCVSVQPKDLKWTLNPCFNKSNIFDFICQKKKVLKSNESHSTIRTTHKIITKSHESTKKLTLLTTNTPFLNKTDPTIKQTSSPQMTSSELSTSAKYGFIILGLIIILSISVNIYIGTKNVKFSTFFKKEPKTKRTKHITTSERRQRNTDILNSCDPNVVFSNIRLN